MKKIFAVLAAAAMMVISALPSFASIPDEYYSTHTVPSERLQPRLVDDADILTEPEETKLLEKLDRISEEYGVDVCVLTINSLGDRSASLYAEDYFAYNGMGQNASHDGFILMLSMEDRDFAFATHGTGIEIYTDYGWRDYMIPQIKPELSAGNYYEAFNEYADISEQFIQEWQKGTPYDVNHRIKGKLSFGWVIGAIIGGAVIGLIVAESIKSQLTSVSMQHGADDYIRTGSFKLTVKRDNFLYKNVTRTHIERSSGSGGGGSHTHSHSSGSSFGGGSGKF